MPVIRSKQRACLVSQLSKTKMCRYHLQGICEYGDDCTFAHSRAEVQRLPDFHKTRLCPAYERGGCNDKDCTFAHGVEDLRSTNNFYKKALCIWNQRGKCTNGRQCRFAHGTSELRTYQGSNGPASGKQEAATGSNEAKILKERTEFPAASCLPAPEPAELPATSLAEAYERDHTWPRGEVARSPMVSQMPNLPGESIVSGIEHLRRNLESLTRKCNEMQMQLDAMNPDLPRANLRDADPTTMGSHLEVVPGPVVESAGAGDLQLLMYITV